MTMRWRPQGEGSGDRPACATYWHGSRRNEGLGRERQGGLAFNLMRRPPLPGGELDRPVTGDATLQICNENLAHLLQLGDALHDGCVYHAILEGGANAPLLDRVYCIGFGCGSCQPNRCASIC